MAEASKFLSYFGSKRKVSSENETNMEKKSKSSEYKFSIIKLWKYQKDFLFWNTPNEKPCNNPSKRVTWIEFDANKKKYWCWVCQQQKAVSNGNNEVTKGRLWNF